MPRAATIGRRATKDTAVGYSRADNTTMSGIDVVLISTYELGRQPFGLASPAAWLAGIGASVTCLDLAIEQLDERRVAAADLVAFYVPMHTATRLAAATIERVKRVNPTAHLCFYGLYATLNAEYLRRLGADTILGGEFEEGLVALATRLMAGERTTQGPLILLAKQRFVVPDRAGLPALQKYARLILATGEQRVVGYTEATRGCKHMCRHCPIPPVYEGTFRVVQPEVVLADVERQVAAGARHITFGDPDFFNGPGHALRVVEALHRRFPDLTYDVTIKVEHLLTHARHLPTLRETGCLFVTSAVESIDPSILAIFDKRHTRDEFVRVVELCRALGLTLNPTFVTFTPWTTLEGYRDLLETVVALDLVDNVAPIQYGIRLLIPAGSKLLDVPLVQKFVEEYDEAALCWRWTHPDPRVDALQVAVLAAVQEGQARGESRRAIFSTVWTLAHAAGGPAGGRPLRLPEPPLAPARAPIPYLSEPWYC